MAVTLTGKYTVVDGTWLHLRAHQKSNPKHIFYKAMLMNDTFESYLESVGHVRVYLESTPSYKGHGVTGAQELRWALKNNWIRHYDPIKDRLPVR